MLRYFFLILPLLFVALLAPNQGFTQRRGLVSSAPCPYSCYSQGLSKRNCRDWRRGNTCYIEDLNRRPAPAAQKPSAVRPPSQQPSYPVAAPAAQSCDTIRHGRLITPRVNIFKVRKSGGFFKDKYRVYGSVEGVCLLEAGYYENGRLVQKVPVKTASTFGRYEFNVQIRSGRSPAIQVYNIHGDRGREEIIPGNY